MTTALANTFSYLRCPECGQQLELTNGSALSNALPERGKLWCSSGHCYPIGGFVPNLLKPSYSKMLKLLKNGKHRPGITTHQIKQASSWLSETLELELDSNAVSKQDKALCRLLSQLCTLLDVGPDAGFSQADVREVWTILSSEAMSTGYRRHVADPAVASLEAVNYEKYEDIVLRKTVIDCLSASRNVAFIELGSGPGRLLHQYGSTISKRENACEMYRRLGPALYQPDSLPNRRNLRLLLGVDFARDMLQSAARWLRSDQLGDLVAEGVIAQLRATVHDLPVAFGSNDWKGTTRIASILFQTLGNQIGREAQLDMLRVARDLVGAKGIVFVSVFNAEAFKDEGTSYYKSIRGSVGAPWYFGERAFLSKRGVYSRWFYRDELRSLFDEAGMSEAMILDDSVLNVFPDFSRYIDIPSQERYKRRALVGLYAKNVDVSVGQL